MTDWVVAAVALASGIGPADTVEHGGVRVRTRVRASVYTYELTNISLEPITRFEAGYRNSYHFKVPEGWQYDCEGDVFRAWTADERLTIRPGQTGTFSYSITSVGAVLGRVPARVVTSSGQAVTLPDLWGSTPEPRGHVLLVAGAVLAIIAFQTLIVARSERRQIPAGVTAT